MSSGGSVVALTTEGAGGSGPGVISIGSNGFLYFDDSQTFSNATITLEGNGAAVEDNVTSTGSSDNGGNPEVLTFGPTLTIIQNAGGDTGYIASTYDDAGPSEIINQGAIEVEAGTLVVESTTYTLAFVNDGAITVSAGTLYIEPNSFTDASGGSITVDNSATASIGSSGASTAWSNAGTVTIDSGGTLYLWVRSPQRALQASPTVTAESISTAR